MRRHPTIRLVLLISAAMGLAPIAGAAQPAKPAAAQPAATAAPAAPVAADPQRTTATFGDWLVRCEQPAAGPKQCDVALIITNAQAQPVAQVAIGHSARTEPMRIMLQVPISVTLGVEPRLVGRDPEKGALVDLTWRRCLPGGCIADAVLREDGVAKLRGLTEAHRLVFQDGAGRETTLPFSPKGLPQALDALVREEPR
jgi:invasion protein IalB